MRNRGGGGDGAYGRRRVPTALVMGEAKSAAKGHINGKAEHESRRAARPRHGSRQRGGFERRHEHRARMRDARHMDVIIIEGVRGRAPD
jgi:hypothetical protein